MTIIFKKYIEVKPKDFIKIVDNFTTSYFDSIYSKGDLKLDIISSSENNEYILNNGLVITTGEKKRKGTKKNFNFAKIIFFNREIGQIKLSLNKPLTYPPVYLISISTDIANQKLVNTVIDSDYNAWAFLTKLINFIKNEFKLKKGLIDSKNETDEENKYQENNYDTGSQSEIEKKLQDHNLINRNYPKIVKLWKEGKKAKEIAGTLSLSEQVVNNYIHIIRESTDEELIPKRRNNNQKNLKIS